MENVSTLIIQYPLYIIAASWPCSLLRRIIIWSTFRSREATNAEYYFGNIHGRLDDEQTLFQTPDDIWKSVRLYDFAHESFNNALDNLYFLSKYLDFWKSSELLRKELLTAINLCNYNQNNAEVNALVGYASFGTSTGGKLFSIKGGNSQVIDSAYRQAQATFQKNCGDKQTSKDSKIRHVAQRVTKVVARSSGGEMDLYGTDDTLLGTYDVVILASPLQMSRISFLQQSHVDELVVTPMPLGGMVQPKRTTKDVEHDGHDILPPDLPDFTKRPYTQVVTTIVSHADFNASYFQLPPRRQPRSIFVTEAGKAALYNITAISQIAEGGVYKIFSNERLDPALLSAIFGPGVQVEFVKVTLTLLVWKMCNINKTAALLKNCLFAALLSPGLGRATWRSNTRFSRSRVFFKFHSLPWRHGQERRVVLRQCHGGRLFVHGKYRNRRQSSGQTRGQ